MTAARLRHRAGRVAEREEPRPPPRLGLVGVDREALVVAAAGMGDVMGQAAQAAAGPAVVDVEHQRRLRAAPSGAGDRRRPGLEAHAADILALAFGPGQRHRGAVAGEHVAFLDPAGDPRLHPLDRAVDVADRAADAGFLAQHVPGFQRVAQFQLDAAEGRRRRHAGSGTRRCGANQAGSSRKPRRPAPPARRGNPARRSAAA